MPPAQLLQALLVLRGLVVGADDGRQVGVEGFAPHPGRVAVLGPSVGRLHLLQNVAVAADDAGEVHDLSQTQDALPSKGFLYVLRAKRCAGCLHVGGRHTGRGHEEEVHGNPAGAVHDVAHPFQPKHIGDLVQVCDGCQGAPGHDGPGELVYVEVGALQVEVPVYEPRRQVLAS